MPHCNHTQLIIKYDSYHLIQSNDKGVQVDLVNKTQNMKSTKTESKIFSNIKWNEKVFYE